MYEQRGDVVEAFADFEDALKKHPTNPVRSTRIFFKNILTNPCAQQAAAGVSRLSSAANAAREKQKAEMLGWTTLLFVWTLLSQLRHYR